MHQMKLSIEPCSKHSQFCAMLGLTSPLHAHKAPVPEPVDEPLPGEHPVPQEDPVPSPNPEQRFTT